MTSPAFGPTGQTVYERSYSRTKPDGSKETWADTVARVVDGNLALVHGPADGWTDDVRAERDELFDLIFEFRAIPGGRHLWASGVPGRQHLFNCHVAGWGQKFSEHFEFTLARLTEGGGVGANYSTRHVGRYPAPPQRLRLHIVCDPAHADYETLKAAGVLSTDFVDDWAGAYEIEDSREGWARALVDLIDTFYRDDVKHADRVYDVSLVRPAGTRLRSFGGTASGPLPLAKLLATVVDVLNGVHDRGDNVRPLDAMAIDQAIGECVVAGGVRRSARMSIVRWDDPDVFDFINCKADHTQHWTTNISVEIDDAFFAALNEPVTAASSDVAFWAAHVHEAVVSGMLANGEPGYWNSSLSNVGEVAEVQATNPCGEIALQPWENCNLGHVNLEAFAGFEDGGDELERAHRLMTRFLMRATYGDVNDPKQAAVLAANRRIGVGHFGVQGFLARNGIRYSDAPRSLQFRRLLGRLQATVRDEARRYAFTLRIPEPVKVTTVAPTGTIAKMPGATEGIHPIYARHFIRRVRFSLLRDEEVAQVAALAAEGYEVESDQYAENTVVVSFPTKERLVAEVEALGLPAETVESADEISLDAMLAFQALYQECYADNAVSFTVNFPEGSLSVDECAETLAKWLPRLKGTTLMPDGTRPQAPYERITAERYAAMVGGSIDDSYDPECASGACPIR